MTTIQYTIQDELGLHARPAGLLVKAAGQFKSKIFLRANDREVSCDRLIALMGLQIKQGQSILIWAEGEDEVHACSALLKFLEDNSV